MADAPQRLGDAHRGRRLAFASGGRVDTRYEHQLATRRTFGDFQRDLRFVLAVEIQVVRAEAKLGRDIDDGSKLRLLCDLDVGRYVGQESSDRASESRASNPAHAIRWRCWGGPGSSRSFTVGHGGRTRWSDVLPGPDQGRRSPS